ncbi:MAG TPA: glucoamylase family protein [Saprospiraceae bacterium]|nr:glucoamylase family protein [Saprospiraceae bacterium]
MLKYLILPFLLINSFLVSHGQAIQLSGSGYDMHAEISWNPFSSADRYEIWRKSETDSQFVLLTTTRKLRWIDWTGREDQLDHVYQYYIDALSVPGNLLSVSDTVSTTITPFSDEQFLDMVQEYTFRYFWEYAHPVSGMARERLGSDDIVATGGTGFGVMSIVAGVHRGFITRQQGVDRLLQVVSFLQFADRFHGVFPHWMNGRTGEVYPFSTFDNGGDLVETAFLMEGLLTARGYFDQDNEKENVLRDVITSLWEDVEWDFYSRNNSGVLYWHWSPQYEWQLNFQIRGYNEALIVYLLAIASPTHPVTASYWESGWAGAGYVSGLKWYGIKLLVGPPLGGPLFFAHYSYQGFDPRNIKDQYANYFVQNTNHTLINRGWCVANPEHHTGYSDQCWGLTASDDPFGYSAHAPGGNTDNGTITPAAALPSMPYTPEESKTVMRHLYQVYGENLWGQYGFYDAFNPDENWFADSYLAIDQGPIINMIENYRSGILWTSFMSNPEIDPALADIGFTEDITSTDHQPLKKFNWTLYPTIGDGHLDITIDEENKNVKWTIDIVDALGRKILFHQYSNNGFQYGLKVDENFSGWARVFITDNLHFSDTKAIWIN